MTPIDRDEYLELCALVERVAPLAPEAAAALLDDAPPHLAAAVREILGGPDSAVARPRELDAAIDHCESLAVAVASHPNAEGVRFIRLLARGGQADVWEAIDLNASDPTTARLAVKVLPRGAKRARFELERRALLRLEHPSIPQVRGAGSTRDGRPYIAMEFVAGTPLVEAANMRALSVRERVQLLLDVILATQHAHERGLVHRDLKPDNVLVVEERGRLRPKVIDFGVARVLDAPVATATTRRETLDGVLIGTPAYMSPEQLRGDGARADVRSDVWALGAMLYELLTGRIPHDISDATMSTAAQLRAFPPVSASRVHADLAPETARALRGDLDAIIDRALEPEPARRYPSAAHFAEDLERFLAGEPAIARQRSRRERVLTFARRHRVAVAMVAAAFIGLAGLSAGSFVALRQERAAHARSRSSLERTLLALRELNDTVGAVSVRDRLSALALEQAELIAGGDPESRLPLIEALIRCGDIARERSDLPTAREFRRRALVEAEAAGSALRDHLRAQRLLSHALIVDGDLAKESGDRRQALQRYRAALAIDEASLRRDENDRTGILLTAWGHERCGAVELLLNELDAARSELERCAVLVEALLATNPDDAEAAYLGAVARNGLTAVLDAAGQCAEADRMRDEIIPYARRLVSLSPTSRRFLLLLAGALSGRAQRLTEAGDYSEAWAMIAEGREAAHRAEATDPGSQDVLAVLMGVERSALTLARASGEAIAASIEACEAVAVRLARLRPDAPGLQLLIEELRSQKQPVAE